MVLSSLTTGRLRFFFIQPSTRELPLEPKQSSLLTTTLTRQLMQGLIRQISLQ